MLRDHSLLLFLYRHIFSSCVIGEKAINEAVMRRFECFSASRMHAEGCRNDIKALIELLSMVLLLQLRECFFFFTFDDLLSVLSVIKVILTAQFMYRSVKGHFLAKYACVHDTGVKT